MNDSDIIVEHALDGSDQCSIGMAHRGRCVYVDVELPNDVGELHLVNAHLRERIDELEDRLAGEIEARLKDKRRWRDTQAKMARAIRRQKAKREAAYDHIAELRQELKRSHSREARARSSQWIPRRAPQGGEAR